MQQPRQENGAAGGGTELLSGNGLAHYTRFIDTLLRERAVVKHGAAPSADDRPELGPPESRRSLATRLRRRRPRTDETAAHKPSINATTSNNNTNTANTGLVEAGGVVSNPVDDQLLLLKLAGVELSSRTAASNTGSRTGNGVTSCVVQRRTERDVSGSPLETEKARVARGTSTKSVERSTRRRRRRRRNYLLRGGAGLDGSCAARRPPPSDQLDTAARSDDRLRVNYAHSAATFGGAESELVARPRGALDRHRQPEEGGCTFRSDGPINTATSRAQDTIRNAAAMSGDYELQLPAASADTAVMDRRRRGVGVADRSDGCVEREMSRRSPVTTSFSSSEGAEIPACSEAVNGRREDDAVGSTERARASVIGFIDGNDERIESFTSDEADEPACVHQVDDQQVDRTSSDSAVRLNRQTSGDGEMTALRPCAGSPQFCSHDARDLGPCRFAEERWLHPRAPAGPPRSCHRSQPSPTHPELATPASSRSRLLGRCRCLIRVAASSPVAATENLVESGSPTPPPTAGPLLQKRSASTSPELRLQLTDDVEQLPADRHAASLSSDDVPRSSRRHLPTDNVVVGHRVYCVVRQTGRRRAGRTSRCTLIFEFLRMILQTKDQQTTLIFARRTKREPSVVGGDDQNMDTPPCECATADDVTPTCRVHDATSDRTQVDRSAVETATYSQFGGSADASRELVASPALTVDDDDNDVSASLTVYEFAEVTSVFRRFAADLLPTTGQVRAARGGATSTALVLRSGPGRTYSGAVVPYRGHPRPQSVLLPLMSWSWDRDRCVGTGRQATDDDVVHTAYVSAGTTINVEPPIDRFTLVAPSSAGTHA